MSELLFFKFKDFLIMKKPIITFVPASRQRINWRGFNQSKILAENLAKLARQECRSILIREGRHKSQVGLRRRERIANMREQIKGDSKEMSTFKGRTILIVDDVYTTGSTLEECAKALRSLGAKEVWGMVLSRD